MEENHQQIAEHEHAPQYKLYSLNSVWGGAFLGGPLMAGFIIAKNFTALGDQVKARTTWLITIVFTVVLFSVLLSVPSISDKVPKQLIPIIYCAAAYGVMKGLQEQKIDAHQQAGGKMFSGWRVFGISLLMLLVTSAPIFGVAMLMDPMSGVETQYFGTSHHEIYYKKDNITEREVLNVGNALQTTWMFDASEEARGIYLVKVGSTYEINVALINEAWNDQQTVRDFKNLRDFLQPSFDNKIVINLCAEFDDVRKRVE